MKALRNAPGVWLHKRGEPLVLDIMGQPAGWAPLVEVGTATVEVREDGPGWEEAHGRWLVGKMPTDDPRWKAGVFCCFGME